MYQHSHYTLHSLTKSSNIRRIERKMSMINVETLVNIFKDDKQDGKM